MNINPKTWNKKQKMITGVILALLIIGGGTTGMIVHNNSVKAEQAKMEKEKAQKDYNELKNQAKKAVELAEMFKLETDVTKADEAIKRLKLDDQKPLLEQTKLLSNLWKQLNEATAKVVTAEKSKKDTDVTIAQKSVDSLKDKKQANQKTALQKRLDLVKSAIQKVKDETDKKAKIPSLQVPQKTNSSDTLSNPDSNTNNNLTNNAPQPPVNQGLNSGSGNSSDSNGTNTGNTQTPQVPTTPTTPPQSPTQPTTPPQKPATTYTGWVRNKAGALVWSQGGFSSLDEAQIAAINWANSQDPEIGYRAGAY